MSPHKKKKTMTYDIGNSGPDLGQALNCSGVKLVNVIYIQAVEWC
jgi:hypothetical protein